HFITHSPWDATRGGSHLRTLVPIRIGILALDDTGFPKQGTASVGVQRQYCGALGKMGNCQVAVSSALIADGRTWPLTFELYVPASWATDAPRRAAVGIPETLRFREKWRIALAHVRTVLKAGFTVTGVVVDADYGSNAAFRDGLERLGLRYAVAIRGGATFEPTCAGLTATAAVIADAASDGCSASDRSTTSENTTCSISPRRPPSRRSSRWPGLGGTSNNSTGNSK